MPFLQLIKGGILGLVFRAIKPLDVKLDSAIPLLVKAETTIRVLLEDTTQLTALAQHDLESALEHLSRLGLIAITKLKKEGIAVEDLGNAVVQRGQLEVLVVWIGFPTRRVQVEDFVSHVEADSYYRMPSEVL